MDVESSTATAVQSDPYHHDGPLAGVCPYVVTSSSCVDEGPVRLVVSPSLPIAVDLTVCHADDLPLNLSLPASSAAAVRRLTGAEPASPARPLHDGQRAASSDGGGPCTHHGGPPPPAHCHAATGRDALSAVQAQWSASSPHRDGPLTDDVGGTSSGGGGVHGVDLLKSLDVLSAAAALRSEMSDRRLVLPAVVDSVALSSSLSSCQVRDDDVSSCR